ncbi:hypothetical protein SteCoe_9851 [Stentor coeruleus]|uniref:Uncharacterized protein n=1 Tax=Stentor coeruleus TaxID=5963 RepID=A0A1R2CH12_9CILI|nr:hypothetical protein SteCoe_9851 [Stentor coeruleus]
MEDKNLSSNIDEEIEFIKSKLNLINPQIIVKSIDESPTFPEVKASSQSSLSLAKQYRRSIKNSGDTETNAIISPIDGSILDDQANDWKSSEGEDKEKTEELCEGLRKKDEIIKILKQENFRLKLRLESQKSQTEQLEVDLEYCMEQNTQAYQEIQDLKSEISSYQESYEHDDSLSSLPVSRLNYKSITDNDLQKSENTRLRQQIEILEHEKNLINFKYKELEKKHSDLMKDILLMKRSQINYLSSPKSSVLNSQNFEHSANTTQATTIDFHRQIAASLEKENKSLKAENNILNKKLAKFELDKKFLTKEPEIIKDLTKLLKVKTEKELYTRIMYINEFYYQNKEQKKLLQKITSYVEKETGEVGITLKELGDFFTV